MFKNIFNRSRREFIRKTFLGTLGLTFWPGFKGLFAKSKKLSQTKQLAEVNFLWSGGITPNSAVVNAKMSEDTTVRLAVSLDSSMTNPFYSQPVDAENSINNRVVRLTIDGLQNDTQYFYAIEEAGTILMDKTGTFNTFPVGQASFSFALASCARTGSDRKVFETIESKAPLFFLHMGDLHYEDINDTDRNIYREAYEDVLDSDRQSSLYRNVPLVYMWDDHDYGHGNSHRDSAGRESAQLTYREYVPHYPLVEGDGTKPIYQAFDVGRVHFILTDLRSERVKPNQPDNADKTMMGDTQKDWLKQQLLLSPNYALVIWVNTVPWIHEQEGEQDHWGGYTTERQELADFINQNGISSNLVMLSGDAHMIAVDDGTNNTYGGGTGFPVIHAASLDRSESEKGGPYSEGAFPGEGQFGVISIVDNGPSDFRLQFVGQDEDGNEILTYEQAFAVLGTPDDEQLPKAFVLEQNYPNPFNGTSTIRFRLPEADQVKLELFDIQGRRVATLLNQKRSAGWHAAEVSSNDLASGSYFYRLTTSQGSAVKRLMLIR